MYSSTFRSLRSVRTLLQPARDDFFTSSDLNAAADLPPFHHDGVSAEPLPYVDAHLIIADKPAGLLAVPGRGPEKQDCLSSRLQARYADALVVHRLDMDTSGLICFGRGADAQRDLSVAFAERRVHKQYQALVWGKLTPATGADDWLLIDLPLLVDWPNRPRSKVDHEAGKPSQTRLRVTAYDAAKDQTRVLLEPLTGRSHQLRVHLLALGHPIVGDPLYGNKKRDEETHSSSRMCLHACALTVPHPLSGEPVSVSSATPF